MLKDSGALTVVDGVPRVWNTTKFWRRDFTDKKSLWEGDNNNPLDTLGVAFQLRPSITSAVLQITSICSPWFCDWSPEHPSLSIFYFWNHTKPTNGK